MTPSAVITIGSGLWMLYAYAWQVYHTNLWIHFKLGLVWILLAFHLYCGYLRKQFQKDRNTHSDVFYRWLNEFPVIILIAIVLLTIIKPF
jgi:putative membrane protein